MLDSPSFSYYLFLFNIANFPTQQIHDITINCSHIADASMSLLNTCHNSTENTVVGRLFWYVEMPDGGGNTFDLTITVSSCSEPFP